MFPPEHPNWVFVPHNGLQGRCYLLEPVARYQRNAFVMVPYCEQGQAKPVFYNLKGSFEADLPPIESTEVDCTITPSLTKEAYLDKLAVIQNHLQRGDIYEINFCMHFDLEGQIDPLLTFSRLYHISQAPYAMLACINGQYVLCASPELYLKKTGHQLVSKPIKGTAPRGKTVEEDERLKEQLHHSLKDRTENVMAVDVARNDLSVVAAKGTVQTTQLFAIETFATVHQMVTTVSCDIRSDLLGDGSESAEGQLFSTLLNATFPMASMTGAPKSSAIHLATQLEGFERQLYSGTMGFIDFKGDFELPVIIRSLFLNPQHKKGWYAAGGAITVLSDAEAEYEECMLKTLTIKKIFKFNP